MTIDLETEAQGSDVPEVQASEAPVEESAPLSRDIVSKIVDRERKKAYEKGRNEALMQMQQEVVPQETNQQPNQPTQSVGLGGMPQMSQQDVERLIAERAPQLLQEHLQAQIQQHKNAQMVESFVAKMQAAEQKYPGLESKLNDLDYKSLAPVIEMANELENTGDIMKELVDNPEKMSTLIILAHAQKPLAQKKLIDLSNSIKVNQEALANDKQARDPMSQLKPSTNAGMDDSTMSVSDFRKMFR